MDLSFTGRISETNYFYNPELYEIIAKCTYYCVHLHRHRHHRESMPFGFDMFAITVELNVDKQC
jgi:hypothetical protein